MPLTAFYTTAEDTLMLDSTALVVRLAMNLEVNRCWGTSPYSWLGILHQFLQSRWVFTWGSLVPFICVEYVFIWFSDMLITDQSLHFCCTGARRSKWPARRGKMRFRQKRRRERTGGGGIHRGAHINDGGNWTRGRVRQSEQGMHPDGHTSPRPKPRVSYWLKCISASTFPTSKSKLYDNHVLPLSWLDLSSFYFLGLSLCFNLLARANSYTVC